VNALLFEPIRGFQRNLTHTVYISYSQAIYGLDVEGRGFKGQGHRKHFKNAALNGFKYVIGDFAILGK